MLARIEGEDSAMTTMMHWSPFTQKFHLHHHHVEDLFPRLFEGAADEVAQPVASWLPAAEGRPEDGTYVIQFALPGADLLLTNAYETLVAGVLESKWMGRGVIDGRQCEHLAFRNFDTDWQLWVETGDRPIPRKMVITSKTVNGAPQYTLRIKSWKSGVVPAADAFSFAAPAGAKKLDPEALGDLDELPQSAAEGTNP